MSQHITSFPNSAKHAPVTKPTYPVPKIEIFMIGPPLTAVGIPTGVVTFFVVKDLNQERLVPCYKLALIVHRGQAILYF